MSFETEGRALLDRGHLIVPIVPGEKRPALAEWQSARIVAADLWRYAGHGVGVLCGQGKYPLAAIDVDTLDEGLANRFADWCYSELGPTCERVGKAPKLLLVYRAAEGGWGKATGALYRDAEGQRHRLEVLGKGQQFVAYATHPDTGKPYFWTGVCGGLADVPATDLPTISREQVEKALAVFEQMAGEAGLVRVGGSAARGARTTASEDDDPLMTYSPPVGLSLDDARKLLAHVDNEDYETWLKAGMALHHEFEGSPDALALWDNWSCSALAYRDFDDLAQRWAGFGRKGRSMTTARWLVKLGHEGERAADRAEKRGALEAMRERIAGCGDSLELLDAVARDAGDVAGEDVALRAELEGLLRARFRAITGTQLPVADARRTMGGAKPAASVKGRQFTEFGNAERMLDRYGESLRYVPELDGWFRWNDVHWQRAAGVEIEHLAKETVRDLPEEAKTLDEAQHADLWRFCAASQRAQMVVHMVRLASSDPRVVVSVTELDQHAHLLGVGNGVVDLRTGKLLPPDQAYLTTISTKVCYVPGAGAPLFEQTVDDVFSGDTEMVQFFQRLVGYTLTGQPREDVLVIPYGCGANGKSTVLGAVREALGGHARMAAADSFLGPSGAPGGFAGGAREDLLRLRGSRMVYVGEPEEGAELREGIVKAMTGGEPLPARGLYARTTVEVQPTWVAWMPTNHRPIVRGDDHAIWRRLLLIPFMRNFDLEGIKDGSRRERLRKEYPGILAWCVRGALAYQKHGLKPPAAVRDAGQEYRDSLDLLGEWLDECCELRADYVEQSSALWASWESFAKQRGELRYLPSMKALARRLVAKGMRPLKRVHDRNSRGFAGLRLTGADDLL